MAETYKMGLLPRELPVLSRRMGSRDGCLLSEPKGGLIFRRSTAGQTLLDRPAQDQVYAWTRRESRERIGQA